MGQCCCHPPDDDFSRSQSLGDSSDEVYMNRDLRNQLQAAKKEIDNLKKENAELRLLLGAPEYYIIKAHYESIK